MFRKMASKLTVGSTVKLNSGYGLPVLGFGVCREMAQLHIEYGLLETDIIPGLPDVSCCLPDVMTHTILVSLVSRCFAQAC